MGEGERLCIKCPSISSNKDCLEILLIILTLSLKVPEWPSTLGAMGRAGHGQAGKLRTTSEPVRVDPGFKSLRLCSNSQGVYFSANRDMVSSKYHIHLRMAETLCVWGWGSRLQDLIPF